MGTRDPASRRTRARASPPPACEQPFPIDAPGPPLGLSLWVARAGDTHRLRHDAPALVFPLDATVLEASRGARTFVVDRSAVLVIPRGTTSLRALSPAARTALLFVHPEARSALEAEYASEVDPELHVRALGRISLVPRHVWLHEIVHRYVFERAVCDKHDSPAARFLELEIPKEIYFLTRDPGTARRSHVEEHGEVVTRAVALLEADLRGAMQVPELARRVGASTSTLLRAFKRELGVAPSEYVRMRRLDEALLLVKAGRHSIGAIAELVGYGTTAAFDHAFRARFGAPPSAFAPRAPEGGR